MADQLAPIPRSSRLTGPLLIVIEVLTLGPLAAVLAFELIPSAFGIEWGCVGDYGVTRTDGDSFAAAVAVFGTLGWLVVLLAALFALIAERERLAVIIPVAWFLVLVVSLTIAAAAIGPTLCPA